jgi:hypothetical protein
MIKIIQKNIPWLVAVVLLLSSCSQPIDDNTQTPTADSSATTSTFFDDFNYSSRDEMVPNGWIVRDGTGWPGVPGAHFRPENVTFLDEPGVPGNKLLRMTSSTDGSAESTFQTQICQQRKYLEGTYAARVRFNNVPVSGPDGDEIVETFYTITPYIKPMEPTYSEMDFEYLANGGWGSGPTSFFVTTWETVQIEPWNADNTSQSVKIDLDGWHTLVAQVSKGEVRYFVDGRLIVQHGGKYYPDAPMSINFNLWFIEGGLLGSGDLRKYQEDIDWVLHLANTEVTPDEINSIVESYRKTSVDFIDTVPAWTPAQDSPCDL